MAILHNRILKEILILCEGVDTERFILCYLNSKALAFDGRFSNEIQTFNFGGIDDLQLYLGNLMKMEGFESVHHLLVLRDAETNVAKAIKMIQKAFQTNNLPVPVEPHQWMKKTDKFAFSTATAFTLLPACNAHPVAGALEDLCWAILKKNMRMK